LEHHVRRTMTKAVTGSDGVSCPGTQPPPLRFPMSATLIQPMSCEWNSPEVGTQQPVLAWHDSSPRILQALAKWDSNPCLAPPRFPRSGSTIATLLLRTSQNSSYENVGFVGVRGHKKAHDTGTAGRGLRASFARTGQSERTAVGGWGEPRRPFIEEDCTAAAVGSLPLMSLASHSRRTLPRLRGTSPAACKLGEVAWTSPMQEGAAS
jgi:hypothetical protein